MNYVSRWKTWTPLASVNPTTRLPIHDFVCGVAGLGFLADAYSIFAIGIASTMLGYVYGECSDSGTVDSTIKSFKTSQDLTLKVALPIGIVIGQILFGCLADVMGRKRIYGKVMLIVIGGTLAQTVVPRTASAWTMVIILSVFRFIVGLGVGGDYPLSAVITAEYAPPRLRGRMLAFVFAGQGIGSLLSALIPFILISAYKKSILDSVGSQNHLETAYIDTMWRIIIGLGIIPSGLAYFFRRKISETPYFTRDILKNNAEVFRNQDTSHDGPSCPSGHSETTGIVEDFRFKGTSVSVSNDPNRTERPGTISLPSASWDDLMKYFGQLRNFATLFGTAFSWFALDVAFYTLNLNTPLILENIAFGKASEYHDELSSCHQAHSGIYYNLITSARGSLILAAAASLPGYIFSFALIDSWGRKPIQLMGFTVLTILFIIMGFAYTDLRLKAKTWFAILYSLASFFQNFGPNVTTFIVPSEIFPTRYRTTAYGIVAACGKLGAVIAQLGFSSIQINNNNDNNAQSVQKILQFIAFFMLSGVFSTFLLPKTKGQSLEDLSGEKQLEDENHREENVPLLQR